MARQWSGWNMSATSSTADKARQGELSPDQLAFIDALETGVRGGPEPDFITLDNSEIRNAKT